MRNSLTLILAGMGIFCALFLTACEQPGSPDFKTEQSVQAPILFNKTFNFLGDANAIIDTTSSNFDSLFSVNQDGLVSLSKESDINIGALDDAIPAISVDPVQVQSQVGPLSFSEFSSSSNGNLGSASFQKVTGRDPATVPAGSPIPGGSTSQPVNIDLQTNNFVSATVQDGGLAITIHNNLGFDLDQIDLVLKSGSQQVGNTATFTNVKYQDSKTADIQFSQGDQLKNLNVDVSVSWSTQTTQAEPGDLVVKDVKGQNFTASQIQAVIPEQKFLNGGNSSISNSDFEFQSDDQYVQLKSGMLNIDKITNGMDITLDTLQVSFPGIRIPGTDGAYSPADSLVLMFAGQNKIERNSSQSNVKSIDLSGARLHATNNKVVFHIVGKTQDSRNGSSTDSIRTIKATDQVSATVGINNLKIDKAIGVVVPKTVTLNTDASTNGKGNLDIYNDTEAEITEIDGLKDVSKQVEGIDFQNASLTLHYSTNLGVESEVYGAIVGVDANGNKVYLHGSTGSPLKVTISDTVGGLMANGAALSADQKIKFKINKATNGTIQSEVTFNADNSNVNEFLNNLPVSIRFIGKALVNPQSQSGTISDPVEFNPGLTVNIPLNLKTTGNGASYKDTVDANLDFLPDQNSDSKVNEATIRINYTNKLPLDVTLKLTFMDDQNQVITNVPLSTQDEITLKAAPVNSDGFVTNATEDQAVIALNSDQLDSMYKTRSLKVNATLVTSGNQEVKIRADDSISLNISAKFKLNSNVNN